MAALCAVLLLFRTRGGGPEVLLVRYVAPITGKAHTPLRAIPALDPCLGPVYCVTLGGYLQEIV